jgi:hypothetical protein
MLKVANTQNNSLLASGSMRADNHVIEAPTTVQQHSPQGSAADNAMVLLAITAV